MDIFTILFECAEITQKLAFITGLVFILKIWKTPSFPILIYLGLVLSTEYFGEALADDQWLYNLLGVTELLAVSYMFYNSVKENLSKKIILIVFYCCLLFLFVDFMFITETINKFLSFAYGFMSFGISIMCFLYLYEIAKTEMVLNQNRVLQYWLSIGLLIFHLCNLPITVLINDLFKIGYVRELLGIQTISSIIMYSCFTIGFIWSKRKYNL